jgi:hypothetical protein
MISATISPRVGIDKDVTKIGEDRRIVLCPRAIAVVERELRLRERMVRADLIEHDHLFFTDSGASTPEVEYPYVRWQRTLNRLAIRYHKPYAARHTSVSWNLMIGTQSAVGRQRARPRDHDNVHSVSGVGRRRRGERHRRHSRGDESPGPDQAQQRSSSAVSSSAARPTM